LLYCIYFVFFAKMNEMLLDEPETVCPSEEVRYGSVRASVRASDSLLVDDGGEVQLRGTIAFFDEARGINYYYRTNPLFYACPYILIQEMCERLAYYGLTPTLKNFVKKILDVSDSSASAYLGIFQGTMFVTPIFSAVIADTYLGGYATILVFSAIYMLGLVHVLLATISEISQPWMLHVGLLVLISLGAGGIKSCVNVFGAQQFHPVAQKEKITSFFTLFYASINVGSLIGGLSCPQVAESVSYFAAYLIPLCSFSLASTIFASGYKRYVKMVPAGSPVVKFAKFLFCALRHRSFSSCRVSQGGEIDDSFVAASLALLKLMPLCGLQVPFLVAYNQMTTAFLTQGEKMKREVFGVSFAAALMQNVDAITVIIASLVVERLLYEKLRSLDRMPSVLSRFIIGNLFGAASLISAFFVELVVKSQEIETVSIWWQVPQFAFIAIGEIFMISTGYEVAFTYAPSELKTVSSACNLIFFAVAGYLSAALFLICADWMPDFKADDPQTYQSAHYDYYFGVLASACFCGCLACLAIRPFFKTMKPYHLLPVESAESC
jgi:solute carrier family 15 (peptide/histidine transporter), member 3/4